MTVTITHSEIDNNGLAPTNPRFGYDHNLDIGAVTQLTVANSYIHDALGGHEIKSRASASTIENNRIQDGTASSSYEIDLANGSNDIVRNNVNKKSPQQAAGYWWRQIRTGLAAGLHEVFCTSVHYCPVKN